MTEGGEHLRLPSEPRHSVWIGRERRGQDLQCNVAAEFGIPGAIHLSHAAAAEHRADFVRAKAGASSERHRLSSGLYEARGTRPHRAPTRLPLLDDFVATDKMGTARGSGRVSKSRSVAGSPLFGSNSRRCGSPASTLFARGCYSPSQRDEGAAATADVTPLIP